MLGADVLNEPCEGKTFRVGVDGNNALKGREALITLTGADGTVKTVTVTQGAAEELSPVIKSFRFRTAANAAKLPQDVVLEVGDGIISGRTSFVVENKVLVPEFEFEGEGVYMGSQEIASGETEVDFSGPVVLTVRNKGGGEREYRVSLVSFTGLPVVYIDTGGIPVVSKEEYVAASLKVVDNNGLQIDGPVDQVCSPYPINEKFKAFNFHVVDLADGNDMDQIAAAFAEARNTKGQPTAIIAHTVKGKGVSFMENQVGWHGKAPNDEEYAIAMEDLKKEGEALCQK